MVKAHFNQRCSWPVPLSGAGWLVWTAARQPDEVGQLLPGRAFKVDIPCSLPPQAHFQTLASK